MTTKIVITNNLWEGLRKFLFRSPKDKERAAFLIAGVSQSPLETTLLARELIALRGEPITKSDSNLEVSPKTIVDLINRSYARGYALVEIHGHPWKGEARMSTIDMKGIEEMARYLQPEFPALPYAAIVATPHSCVGEVWVAGKRTDPEVRIVGRGIGSQVNGLQIDTELFDRQILFLEEDGQEQLSSYRVGIVGLGGTGSHIAQQLAYLGVRNFVLIDPDKVESSNLNRLIGANKKDVGAFKVKMGARTIRKANPEAQVTEIPLTLFSSRSLQFLKNVDFIFGCVDSDGARLVLNHLSCAYLIPYIDVASDIILEEEEIAEMGGSVFCVIPGESCLYCGPEIDITEARDDLSSEEECKERVRRGYAKGRIISPAVVSINGLVSSHAVTEFLFYVLGIPTKAKTLYDLKGRLASFQSINKREDCIHCVGDFGKGDKAHIEGYSRDLQGTGGEYGWLNWFRRVQKYYQLWQGRR